MQIYYKHRISLELRSSNWHPFSLCATITGSKLVTQINFGKLLSFLLDVYVLCVWFFYVVSKKNKLKWLIMGVSKATLNTPNLWKVYCSFHPQNQRHILSNTKSWLLSVVDLTICWDVTPSPKTTMYVKKVTLWCKLTLWIITYGSRNLQWHVYSHILG